MTNRVLWSKLTYKTFYPDNSLANLIKMVWAGLRPMIRSMIRPRLLGRPIGVRKMRSPSQKWGTKLRRRPPHLVEQCESGNTQWYSRSSEPKHRKLVANSPSQRANPRSEGKNKKRKIWIFKFPNVIRLDNDKVWNAKLSCYFGENLAEGECRMFSKCAWRNPRVDVYTNIYEMIPVEDLQVLQWRISILANL